MTGDSRPAQMLELMRPAHQRLGTGLGAGARLGAGALMRRPWR
jgi:hypothetical protein